MGSLLDRLDTSEMGTEFEPEFSQEFEPEYEQDPVPELDPETAAAPASKRIGARFRPAGPVVNAATRRRISAELQVYCELVAGLGSLKCEPCAEVARKQIKPFCDRAASIIGRYPDLAEKLIKTGAIGDWIGVASALAPVAQSVVSHHVTHTREHDELGETGGIDPGQYPAYRPR